MKVYGVHLFVHSCHHTWLCKSEQCVVFPCFIVIALDTGFLNVIALKSTDVMSMAVTVVVVKK